VFRGILIDGVLQDTAEGFSTHVSSILMIRVQGWGHSVLEEHRGPGFYFLCAIVWLCFLNLFFAYKMICKSFQAL
jgi:hypothetical protein